jgi:nickel-type superoxide dismutase maturation protease
MSFGPTRDLDVMRRWAVIAILAYSGALAANRSQVVVQGASMEPALWPGDRLLTVPALPRALRAGMVVVVADPTDPSHRVVKRIREVGGGTVDVRGDAPDRSTDSRVWGRLPVRSVRRVAVARWPDLRTPLRRDLP